MKIKNHVAVKFRAYPTEEQARQIDRDLNAAINLDVAGSAPEDDKRARRAHKTKASWRTPEKPLQPVGEGNANQAAVLTHCLRLGADAGNGVLSTRTN